MIKTKLLNQLLSSKWFKLSNIVNYNGVSYLVDTSDTFDRGLETMIFKLYKHFDNANDMEQIEYNDVDWNDLYQEHYSSGEEAERKHKDIVNNIGKYLERIDDE